jgi:long-chain acyl-CoA synthetase
VKMLAVPHEGDEGRRPDLRLCISGGEPRNEVAFARWSALTGCPVHDVYCGSECFPVVTYDPVRYPTPVPGAAGRVIEGSAMRLVGADGSDAGGGEPGEAWMRGPGMMLGYWHDAAQTAAALSPDGWYRSGDLVEIDADGYVRVVGRLSDLIIRGGANVSPAEVERVLVGHPSIREASVVGLPDAVYGQQVVAAVALEPGWLLDVDVLQAHCAASLAHFKVPTRFCALDSLPRNPNTGKVQRRDVVARLSEQL